MRDFKIFKRTLNGAVMRPEQISYLLLINCKFPLTIEIHIINRPIEVVSQSVQPHDLFLNYLIALI